MAPHINRNTNIAGQFGAKVHAIVPKRNTVKLPSRTGLLPIVSLSGLKNKGPTTYPIRKTAVGRTFCMSPVTLNSRIIAGTTLLGKEDDIPELSTRKSAVRTVNIFFP